MPAFDRSLLDNLSKQFPQILAGVLAIVALVMGILAGTQANPEGSSQNEPATFATNPGGPADIR